MKFCNRHYFSNEVSQIVDTKYNYITKITLIRNQQLMIEHQNIMSCGRLRSIIIQHFEPKWVGIIESISKLIT